MGWKRLAGSNGQSKSRWWIMRILLFLLIPFLIFAQDDWSDANINYPNSFDDTTSFWHADSTDYVPGSFYNKIMRAARTLQERVGTGVDTPKTVKEILIVVAEDSTIWRILLPSDIAQEGASSGQVIKWNGSIWAPAADVSGAGGTDYADSLTHDGRHVIGDSMITDAEGDARFQPLESTLTDIADGTIVEDLVNTANPWADNEVADNISITSMAQIADAEEAIEDSVGDMVTGNTETNIAVTYQDTDGTLDFVVTLRTEEEIEDFVGGMLGGTETGIAVTYQDASNDIDFVTEVTQTEYDLISDDTTNFQTAYTHSQDNTQAHTDYLLNSGSDIMSGTLTSDGLNTERALMDTLAGKTGNTVVLEDTLTGITYIGVDSLSINDVQIDSMTYIDAATDTLRFWVNGKSFRITEE